jgi:hypothetical protein
VRKEIANPDPELEKIMEESEELLAYVGASSRESMIPENSEEPNEEERESDDGEEVEETLEEEAQPSPFQLVAGVQGKFPPSWRKRHKMRGLLDDN